ncbi:hypothetical protein [Haloarcula salinisoli]|uniref:Uncharacterized protein n=1 Tax=Haloarcula salinisoli TaxID=2487746 RepID=A0A8J8CAT5_9EURY|nr:hypothetical protein [Halomicroarcula salinisoli]MBX0285014.1 hypothetical protein [Halomicroarcula salinisoli]MBX0303508.1 hypothetical protein [Halomicroarcula salinisoli]
MDDSATVDPTDRETLRGHLERFATPDSVTADADGTLTARFSSSTYVSIDPEGHVRTGMPLHAFDGPAERLHFDHGDGELHVATAEEAISYTFRRP